MFSKINEVLKGLRIFPDIVSSVKEGTILQYRWLKLCIVNQVMIFKLSRYLSCSVSIIVSYYKHIGKKHAEFANKNNGVFLAKSHNLIKIFPTIYVCTNSLSCYNNLEFSLQSYLSQTIHIPFKPDEWQEANQLPSELNSISIPFTLEQLETLNDIDSFLVILKSKLSTKKTGGIIFGAVALKELNSQKKYSKYCAWLKEQNININKELTIESLVPLFNKHFKNVVLYNKGACLFFTLENEVEKIKHKTILPKDDPLIIPFYKKYQF